MENRMEDYKKISDSLESYSDTELDLIKRDLIVFSKVFLSDEFSLEEFDVVLDLIEKIDDEMNKRGEVAYV